MTRQITFKDILNELSKRELRLADLEKENAELDCQKNRNKFCYSCANAEDRCFRNEIGCPCEKYKSYKEENAELKKELNIRSCQNCKRNNKSCPNDGSCKNYSKWKGYENPQLIKAKELLNEFMRISKASDEDFEHDYSELIKEAEQFLRRYHNDR